MTNKSCPFCGSDVKPSPGLEGVYQHASNVDECIIGDLGIKSIAAWNRRPAEALVEHDAIYTPDQQRAADYMAEITSIGGGPDPVGSLIAIHNAQRVKREALVEALVEALEAIDALEPLEINPSNYTHDDVCELNRNSVQAALIARNALAAHRSWA